MDRFQVDTGQLGEAAEGVRRAAGHLASMADYCESLAKGGGSFGSLMQGFRNGYENASISQVRALDDMKSKVEKMAVAVEAVRKQYEDNEVAIGEALGEIIDRLDRNRTVVVRGGAR